VSEAVDLNPRQIGLLRDFRVHGLMAFFDSPFRMEGPGLRDLGMIGGVGDSTAITAEGMVALKQADAAITRNVAALRTESSK
jgi:hypothetical protein